MQFESCLVPTRSVATKAVRQELNTTAYEYALSIVEDSTAAGIVVFSVALPGELWHSEWENVSYVVTGT